MFGKKKTIIICVLLCVCVSTNADIVMSQRTRMRMANNAGDYSLNVSSLSPDGLSLYLSGSEGRPTLGHGDLWVMKRATINDRWGSPTLLDTPISTDRSDTAACMTADGLELFFSSYRGGGCGDQDIWVAKRASRNDPWGCPANLGDPVNTCKEECLGSVSADGLELYFTTMGKQTSKKLCGGCDIWMSTRASREENWSDPTNLGSPINTPYTEKTPCISADGLMLLLASDRPGGYGSMDMWITARPTTSDPWCPPRNLGYQINTNGCEQAAGFCCEESCLYFSCTGENENDEKIIYKATLDPMVDLNRDGSINSDDILEAMRYWDTDDSLCDIGPAPFGDGRVDEQDLLVLYDFILSGENPNLLAYWKLDEVEGEIAYDSTGAYHAFVKGDPVWRPEEGYIGGALQFDGLDDYVTTSYVAIPPFKKAMSMFAWIKGGNDHQVILSQNLRENCLLIGEGGVLASTWVQDRKLCTLTSDRVVNDNEWYHVGCVWDGRSSNLYIDNITVASQPRNKCQTYSQGFNIGVGLNKQAESYWDGLIDDVKIYNQAIMP